MADIDRVFVARRPLNPGASNWQKKGALAHSALLLRTTDGKHYILEFMADSKASVREITLNVTHTEREPRPHQIFVLDGVEWTKQLHGKEPPSGWTTERVSITEQH